MEDKLNLTTRNRCDTFAHLKISKPPFLFHIPVQNFGQGFFQSERRAYISRSPAKTLPY